MRPNHWGLHVFLLPCANSLCKCRERTCRKSWYQVRSADRLSRPICSLICAGHNQASCRGWLRQSAQHHDIRTHDDQTGPKRHGGNPPRPHHDALVLPFIATVESSIMFCFPVFTCFETIYRCAEGRDCRHNATQRPQEAESRSAGHIPAVRLSRNATPPCVPRGTALHSLMHSACDKRVFSGADDLSGWKKMKAVTSKEQVEEIMGDGFVPRLSATGGVDLSLILHHFKVQG